jgi:hypothetical protein
MTSRHPAPLDEAHGRGIGWSVEEAVRFRTRIQVGRKVRPWPECHYSGLHELGRGIGVSAGPAA